MSRLLVVAVLAACSGGGRTPPAAGPRAPQLPPPIAIDGRARGAAYLTSISAQLQPPWGQFLEDCRVRLAPTHPLNRPSLAARADVAIDRSGTLTVIGVTTSGLADFDLVVRQILADQAHVPPPPVELLSDDDQLHLRWLFARDLRQAGPATAEITVVDLPVLAVTQKLLARGDLARAARRAASAKSDDPERAAATEAVMLAALGEALGSVGAAARTTAVEAVGRISGKGRGLASQVRAFLAPTVDTELRLAAVVASARLRDTSAAPIIARQLGNDLASYPRLALAEVAALVELGARDDAAAAIQRALEADPRTPPVSALQAHALVPLPALTAKLARWYATGDARTRAAVCASVPAQTEDATPAYVARGLRDADATVRATCVDAAARQGKARATPEVVRRLRELAIDRDREVRARAVAALAVIDPTRAIRAANDPAPEVRAAAIAAASETDLRALAMDPDPDVRAAAVSRLADRAPDLLSRAAADVAPQVRRAAALALADEDVLSRLATDVAPEVATAAQITLASRRGRAASTGALLGQLASAPAGSAERVRIALAWLLAGP